MTFRDVGLVLIRIVASTIDGGMLVARGTTVATMVVAEHLLLLVSVDLACDVKRLKDAFVEKHVAEGDAAKAEARLRVAAAVDAENQLTARRYEEAAAAAQLKLEGEARMVAAGARKAEAEADEAQLRAREATKQAEIADAVDDLKTALRRLRSKGGDAFFDVDELRALLARPVNAEEASTKVTPASGTLSIEGGPPQVEKS